MGNFGELSGIKQWAALMLAAALVSVGLHYTMFKSKREANDQAQQNLQTQIARECGTGILPAQAQRHGTASRQSQATVGD